MKSPALKFKKTIAVLLISSLGLQVSACTNNIAQERTVAAPIHDAAVKIQVALLLDTSNSMDGLIQQAKSRLWQIVNTLSTLKYQGKEPILEIALYEYGNDNLSAATGYIRKVTPFTTDLDYLSEKLFALSTNGGLEYCGQVIKQAFNQLEWSNNNHSIKLMYIAGNEEYNQGPIDFREISASVTAKNIYINTIYCGDKQSGISEYWRDGAKSGKGKYFNIDHNKNIRHIATPYDEQIAAKNEAINKTYISYNRAGASKKQNQIAQDANASTMAKEVYTERAVSKSKASYKNESWDLVDAYKADKNTMTKVEKNALPQDMQNLSDKELEQKIAQLEKERIQLQKDISILATQRENYIKDQQRLTPNNTGDDLGTAISNSIIELANSKNYTQE